MNKKSELDFANVRSGVQSTAVGMPLAAKGDITNAQSHSNSVAEEATIYAVATGDSPSKIAKQFYGDANAWKQIFDANRDQLTDPEGIKVGQMLKIPAKI